MITHWVIREWMNAVTLALFICLFFRFWKVRRDSLPTEPRRPAATALMVLSFGEVLRSAWAWLALAAQNKQWEIFPLVQGWWIAGVAAAGLITVGAVCCIRVFSGKRGGGLGAAVLAIAFLLITIAL